MNGIVASEPAGVVAITHGREVEYPIDQIVIGPRKRDVRNTDKVAAMAQSMAELGLINAISLLPDGTLITGNHRVTAARLLGWTTIRAIIRDVDEINARLNEIDENLFREDLTVLQQAEHIAEREEILRAKGLRAERGENRYTLAQYGLDEDEVRAAFADYIAHFAIPSEAQGVAGS